MEVKKKLMMTFKTDEDNNVSISLDEPRDNITEQEIQNAMNIILNNDIFAPNGETLISLVGAKIVETGTTEFDLVL